MKCIKNKEGEIRRVKEDEADLKVKVHGWKFVPKSEWKLASRKKVEVQHDMGGSYEVTEKKSKKNKK